MNRNDPLKYISKGVAFNFDLSGTPSWKILTKLSIVFISKPFPK